jgi:hypothetical protein
MKKAFEILFGLVIIYAVIALIDIYLVQAYILALVGFGIFVVGASAIGISGLMSKDSATAGGAAMFLWLAIIAAINVGLAAAMVLAPYYLVKYIWMLL